MMIVGGDNFVCVFSSRGDSCVAMCETYEVVEVVVIVIVVIYVWL